ncbi:hypothetical protein LABALGNA3A7_09900 [Dellaglioa algida]|nr:hypothetical protein LABALGNA3A7_09900 [Dellaglioa algida]
MKIKSEAKNGVITLAYKVYNELTEVERAALIIPAGSSFDDYTNFAVHYNKKNELIRVVTHSFSQEKNDSIDANSTKPSLIDSMKLLYGNAGQKSAARKVYKNDGISLSSNKQIASALRGLK